MSPEKMTEAETAIRQQVTREQFRAAYRATREAKEQVFSFDRPELDLFALTAAHWAFLAREQAPKAFAGAVLHAMSEKRRMEETPLRHFAAQRAAEEYGLFKIYGAPATA
jgi:hypothetical protein